MSGLLRLADALAVAVCAIFAFWLRNDLDGLPAHYTLAILLAVVLLANAAQLTKLYEFRTMMRLRGQFGRVTLVWMTVIVALIVVAYLTKTSSNFSRIWAVTWFVTTSAVLILNRVIAVHRIDRWRAQGKLTRRLAIIGEGTRATRIRARVASAYSRDAVLTGVYAPGNPVKTATGTVDGGLDDLLAAVTAGDVDEVVIAVDAAFPTDALRHLVGTLGTTPVEVRFAPDTQDLPFPVLGTSYLGGVPLFDVHLRPLSVWSRVIKRIEDIVLGSLLLLLLAPLMAVIAALIRLTSPGPVMFRQPRLGFNNNAFTLYKFRTMREDASRADEAPGADPVQARRNDPRLTTMGAILRRISLDELPQLFNVIKGEMSLVGPRPHAIAHNREYAGMLDGYLGRHRVKPGITGWAQVCGLRGETDSLEKMRARVEHDLYYIEHWSLWFDLKILVLTLVFGFIHPNAY